MHYHTRHTFSQTRLNCLLWNWCIHVLFMVQGIMIAERVLILELFVTERADFILVLLLMLVPVVPVL